jgi:hypothetical protein
MGTGSKPRHAADMRSACSACSGPATEPNRPSLARPIASEASPRGETMPMHSAHTAWRAWSRARSERVTWHDSWRLTSD